MDMWSGVCNHSWNLVAYQVESISLLSSWLHLNRMLSMSFFLTRFAYCESAHIWSHRILPIKSHVAGRFIVNFLRTLHKQQNEHYLIPQKKPCQLQHTFGIFASIRWRWLIKLRIDEYYSRAHKASCFFVFVCFIELSCDRLHQHRANGYF